MAFPSIGRGRGRAKNLSAALSKPVGEPKSNKYSSLETSNPSAFNEVETSMILCLKSPSDANLIDLHKQVQSFVTMNNDAVAKLVDLLCDKSFAERDMATSSGEVASSLIGLENIGGSVRSTLLKKIQVCFKNRDDLSKKDFGNFLGFTTLLCSLFQWLRVNDEPLKPLTSPIYQLLDELLDSKASSPPQREEEIETFHNCLLMVAGTLEICDKKKMDELFKKVRQTILKKASPKMRCLLLETLEYYASGNWTTNNDIKVYYSDLLSDIMATV